jgi:CheY-like chemotaxis protein
MRILIVDDSVAKIADVVTALRDISDAFDIEYSNDCIDAINKLKQKFDLILLDLLLPLRVGEQPKNDGGKYIVNEIYRNKKIKPPTYILCLTQHEELINDFHPIWRTIKYDKTEIKWKHALRELVVYITRQDSTDDRIIIDKIPTIFLEGKTDDKLISEALKLFFPEYIGKVRIKSDIGAGASWVTRQLTIWGTSLPKDENGNPIKSAGIYDNDKSGNDAIEELRRTIGETSAATKCIKTFKYTTKYASHLIPVYVKGIKLPITLEEMFDSEIWGHASENKWLEDRNDIEFLLQDPTNWNKRAMGLDDHIKSLGFSEKEALYLNKVCNESKHAFADFVLKMDEHKRRVALKCFQPLLRDVLENIICSIE